jgi:glycine cleavage system H protein
LFLEKSLFPSTRETFPAELHPRKKISSPFENQNHVEETLNTPEHLKYNRLDLWVRVDATTATIGVTDYAQDQLSDVVFADIKVSPGDSIEAGELVAVIESVKASSDIEAPVSGKVLAINEELTSSPEMINEDPYERAWILKLEMNRPDEPDNLLDAVAYQQYRNL